MRISPSTGNAGRVRHLYGRSGGGQTTEMLKAFRETGRSKEMIRRPSERALFNRVDKQFDLGKQILAWTLWYLGSEGVTVSLA